MITFRVESFNGAPAQALSATFDERGGTVGRLESNGLVLPDPEQLVSRVHARVEWRGGAFILTDHGSNPAMLNGLPLGSGHEAPLSDGDRLQIGGFMIAVSCARPAHGPATAIRTERTAIPAKRAPAAPAAGSSRFPDHPLPFVDIPVLDPPDRALPAQRGGPDTGCSWFDVETATELEPAAPPHASTRTFQNGSLRAHPGGSTQAIAPTRPAALNADATVLLGALLEGLDTPGLDMDCLDADRMRAIGALLHEATHCTVQLLQGRAAFKRELRAQVTTMQRRENNPLKFSPDAGTALRHLLDPQSPGFMAAQEAMEDACDDLRAHQIAVMAGMRAALDGLLERFSPPALERRIAPRAGLAALLPAARKAELWEQFGVLYGKISQEASDGFYDLLGSSFLKAYEAEARRLRKHG